MGSLLITKIFFLNEEGKFIESLIESLIEWKGRPKVEARRCYYVWNFVFIWSGKLYFYQGKVREILKSGVCGNHDAFFL